MLRPLVFTLLLCCAFFTLTKGKAQCTHDPTVTGDLILCPNESGVLSTQTFDSYQWYKRPYGNPTWQLIPSATNQTLNVTPSDVSWYFRVDAALNNCTEASPEILLDSWAFLPPTVQTTGDFWVDQGETHACIGDTVYYIMMLPYDTLIQWYDNGNPISGANDDTLIVTQPGSYTVSGAPSICPNFNQTLGVVLNTVFINCATSVEENGLSQFSIYPNPTAGNVIIEMKKEANIIAIELVDMLGKTIQQDQFAGQSQFNIEMDNVPKGVYLIRIKPDNKSIVTHRIVKE